MKEKLTIIGWHRGWRKVSSVQAIKEIGGLGLGTSKETVDSALDGNQAEVFAEGNEACLKLAQRLADLGAVVIYRGKTYDGFPDEECVIKRQRPQKAKP